ncbi:branched-chain amino acid ABC transporter permease [Reyranella sp.]|uniref:branched-chain amino acid ABC transporter permease n=1 Tax=Reyranella sp. TaxID=1929291 RepID=UPI002F94E3CA
MTRSTRRWLWFVGAVATAAAVPFAVPHPFLFNLLIQAAIWALVTASWDLLGGYAGQISFGHSGFFALGAYTAAGLAYHLHVSPWFGLVAGAILCSLVGLCVGFPALRLRGHYLALVTLGFAEIIRLVAQNWVQMTGGPFGMHDFGTLPGLPTALLRYNETLYLVVLGIAAAAIALMLTVCEHTDAGKAFRAIREDQVLAESHGINIKVYKLYAFALSAALAGLAGGLYAFSIGLVDPNLASPLTSAMILGMAVFGGIGTIWGPALGAVLLFMMSEGLRFVGVVYNLIAFGLVIMVFVIFVPRGVAGLRLGRNERLSRRDLLQSEQAGTRPDPVQRREVI